MQAIRIPLKKFDLDRFICETLRFLDGKANYPTLAITWVEAPGRCPNDEAYDSWDFKSKLLTEAVYLFFPFALPDMEGSFDCADGQSYMDPWDARQGLDEGEEEPEDEEDERDESPFIGESIVGYLVQVNGGTISVASAVCPMCGCFPPPTVDLLSDGGFLEKPLVEFITGFVLKEAQEGSFTSSFNIEDFRVKARES